MIKLSKKVLLSLVVLGFSTSAVVADIAEKTPAQKKKVEIEREFTNSWQITFGGSARDVAYDVAAGKDDSVMVVGSCRSYGEGREDILAMKVSSDGKMLWKKTFGKKRKDVAHAITRTADGNFVAVGETQSFSETGDTDVYVV